MGRQSKYPEEFRRKAAALVLDSGRSTRDAGRELGVNHETLRGWVQALRRERCEGPAAISADDRLELARLRRRVAELELEKEILRKSRGLLRSGNRPVTREVFDGFIAAEKTTYPVRLLCRVLQVTPRRSTTGSAAAIPPSRWAPRSGLRPE